MRRYSADRSIYQMSTRRLWRMLLTPRILRVGRWSGLSPDIYSLNESFISFFKNTVLTFGTSWKIYWSKIPRNRPFPLLPSVSAPFRVPEPSQWSLRPQPQPCSHPDPTPLESGPISFRGVSSHPYLRPDRTRRASDHHCPHPSPHQPPVTILISPPSNPSPLHRCALPPCGRRRLQSRLPRRLPSRLPSSKCCHRHLDRLLARSQLELRRPERAGRPNLMAPSSARAALRHHRGRSIDLAVDTDLLHLRSRRGMECSESDLDVLCFPSEINYIRWRESLRRLPRS